LKQVLLEHGIHVNEIKVIKR